MENMDLTKFALDNCETMIYSVNEASPAIGARTYISAADISAYEKLFTFTDFPDISNGEVMDTKNALAAYTFEEAGNFVENHGPHWFFCKCKKSSCCTISEYVFK